MTSLCIPSQKRVLAVAALTMAALTAPSVALAHPGHPDSAGVGVTDEGVILPGSQATKQHEGEGGHLPGSSENVELVGRVDIEGAAEGRVADVAAFGDFAYLTVRDPEGCSGAGVAVIDISDPTRPRQVGFIDATEGSLPGEGAQVLDLLTPAFRGQVLVFNNEICSVDDPETPEVEPTGEGGVSLWDVSDPRNPRVLIPHAGDPTIELPAGVERPYELNQTHSALAWQDGRRAFVGIVDNEEGEDLDILEITDPANPVLLSETDLDTFRVLQEDEGRPLGGNSFLHDLEVQRIRGTMTLVASYWDGGWVLLDVDDPATPVYLRDFDYPRRDAETGLVPSEGNAHQAEFSPSGRLLIGTDEDFNPYRLTVTSGGRTFQAAQGSDTPQLDANTRLTGPTTYIGLACTTTSPDDSAFPAATADGQVGVIERGVCTFTEKVQAAEKAGYDGVVLFNSVRPDGCTAIVTPSVQAGIPVASVGRDTGYALFGAPYDNAACLAGAAGSATPFAVGTTGEGVSVSAVFDGWGYVRLLDTQTMCQLDTYALEESLDPAFAEGFGDLSVHEVAVDPHRNGIAYLSYYSGGLRVIDYNRNGMREVGHYIDEGGNNFWGVEVHRLPGRGAGWGSLVLASDRDSGLWIFRYTGD
jgi:hypothetical protein